MSMGWASRIREGLSRTRRQLVEKVEALVAGRRTLDEGLFQELEEILVGSDVGVKTALELVAGLRDTVRRRSIVDPAKLLPLLKETMRGHLDGGHTRLNLSPDGLTVIMLVGVNGVGKTTTLAKLAYRLKASGKKVILAASDTFRAAAIEQLEAWGGRVGAEVIHHREGADPAAVVFDAIQAARARRAEVLLVDTAGRLHTRINLMEELKKIRRVISREVSGAPQEVLLVLDAVTGQNALQQARLFGEAVGVTGLVLTKLDGTAKGGVVLAVKKELGVPVKFIGVGEAMEDLQPFDPGEFVEALFA